jgi:hypothetical protein
VTANTRTVEYHDDDLDVEIIVQQADYLGTRIRTSLQAVGREYYERLSRRRLSRVELLAREIMALHLWPDFLASVQRMRGLDRRMSIDEFVGLPAQLIEAWREAVYDLNPGWLPGEHELGFLTFHGVARGSWA